MGRMLKQVLDALPPKRRAKIDRRFKELVTRSSRLGNSSAREPVSKRRWRKTLKISQPASAK